MPNADVAHHRRRFLDLSKALCEALARREHRYPELCVRFELEEDERKEVLTKIAKESKEIARLSEELKKVESASPAPIGVKAIFGDTVISDHIRCAFKVVLTTRS